MFKKIMLFIFLFLVSSLAYTMKVEAADLRCKYEKGYEFWVSGDEVSYNINGKDPEKYAPTIVYSDSAVKAGDFKLVTEDKCPTNLYVKTVASTVTPQGTVTPTQIYLSFTSTTYDDAETLSFTGGTVGGKNVDENGDETGPGNIIITPGGEQIDCGAFEVADNVNLVNSLFGIMMILAPILLLVLGSVDFMKATLSNDEQALRKAGINFGKRALATILLFLLPLILNFIFAVAFNAGIFGSLGEKPSACVDVD